MSARMRVVFGPGSKAEAQAHRCEPHGRAARTVASAVPSRQRPVRAALAILGGGSAGVWRR